MIDSKLKCIFLSTLDQGSQFLLESKVKKFPVGQIYSIERMKRERERERDGVWCGGVGEIQLADRLAT